MSAMHPFTRAGLGQSPFRCTGVAENWHEMPGFGRKPGGCCNYCGTGILYEYQILSADGKKFVVGSDCVRKTNAEVEGFREQRLNLARTKRSVRRQIDHEARRAQWLERARIKRAAFDEAHPDVVAYLLAKSESNAFLTDLLNSLTAYGELTNPQLAAVQNNIARDLLQARLQANSVWLGEPGDKIGGEFVIIRTSSWLSDYGWPRKTTYLSVMQQDNNVIAYIGSNRLGDRGQKIRATFTVKKHDEREGTKQTIVNRPRKIEVL